MPFTVPNVDTATLASNLMREGHEIHFSPLEHFDGIPDASFPDLGSFPPDAKIAPNAAVDQSDILAQNREGGPDVLLAIDTKKITITYEAPVITPDAMVTALHNNAPATQITDGPLQGATISPYAPGGSVSGRLVVISRREGKDQVRVAWHPRAFLQNNGVGDSQGRETLLFKFTVQAFAYAPGANLKAYTSQITQYGAIFMVTREQLAALLDILADEALPTTPVVTPAVPVVTEPDPATTEPTNP